MPLPELLHSLCHKFFHQNVTVLWDAVEIKENLAMTAALLLAHKVPLLVRLILLLADVLIDGAL